MLGGRVRNRGLALALAAAVVLLGAPWAVAAGMATRERVTSSATGAMVLCLRPDRPSTEQPTGRVYSEGVVTRAAQVYISADPQEDYCDRAPLPAGGYVVSVDRLRVPGCRTPAVTRILIRRNGFSHTSPTEGFTATAVTAAETTRVEFTLGCKDVGTPR